jgi:peptide/nickel transport system substrate-binding protein
MMKRIPHWRRSATLFLVLAMVFALSGLAAVAQDEKVLVIGHAESTDSYDPSRGYTQTSGIVEHAVYQTLVTFPDGDASSILPMLATSWDVSDDGLTYTFHLKEDAVFSSGNPVIADDVVFSFNRLKNVKSSPAFLADNFSTVEAMDAHTVVITLPGANPAFISLLPNNAFSVTDSKLIMENGGTDAADAADSDKAETFLNQTSAGSGAYMLTKWEPQVETTLERNPNYQGTAPYFDKVIINNIAEAASQKAALEAGDVDIALDLTSDQIATLKGNADISIFSGPGNIVHFLLMNENKDIGGPVSDPKVQLAIRYALDYEGYKALWGGVQPGTNLVVGLAGAYGEDKALKRDVDMAKSLLSDAGYPDGFEIKLSYPDFTFQGVNMNTNAQKIQSDLADVGIKVTLDVGDLQTKLQAYRDGTDGFSYWFWGPDILDPSDFLSFLPGGKVASERANWNLDSAPADIASLITQVKVESDQTKRLAEYGQLQDFAEQNSAFAPFNQPDIQTAFRANLQGYVWHPQWLIDPALLSRS